MVKGCNERLKILLVRIKKFIKGFESFETFPKGYLTIQNHLKRRRLRRKRKIILIVHILMIISKMYFLIGRNTRKREVNHTNLRNTLINHAIRINKLI